MSDDITFQQSSFGTRVRHAFQEDKLEYTLRDLDGEVQFSVWYEHILISAPYTLIVKDKPFFRLISRGAVVVLGISLLIDLVQNRLGSAILVAAVLSYVALYVANSMNLFSIKCTMLKMEPAPPGAGPRHLRIMHDKALEQILKEYELRWIARLRKLHLAINPANDRNKEIAKYMWLKERSVISEEECQQAVDQLRKEEFVRSTLN